MRETNRNHYMAIKKKSEQTNNLTLDVISRIDWGGERVRILST